MAQSRFMYTDVPTIYEDFDSACAAHARALLAIEYWTDILKGIDNLSAQHKQLSKTLSQWKHVKKNSARLIASYQITLF